MFRSWDDLPEECWESILNRLNQDRHLEPLSFVCKRFLSISNRLRLSLTITDPTILFHRSISRLLHRFPQLKRIEILEFNGSNLDQLVRDIARSDLSLEALNLSKQRRIPVEGLKEFDSKMDLKILICSKLSCLQDSDLKVIADSFPQLEELDISYPEQDVDATILHPPLDLEFGAVSGIVTDEGIETLASNLRGLRKINLSGNHFISDRSLIALASNCCFLSEISICDCSFISQNGVGLVLNYRPTLASVTISGNKMCSFLPSNAIETSLRYAKALRVLDFSQMFISDEFLILLARANLPFEKLALSRCQGFTFTGVSLLLHTIRSLKSLNLEGADCLNDDYIDYLSHYLHDLTFINLNSCSNLTSSTFFTLLGNCPSLVEIQMEETSLGNGDYSTFLKKHSEIRSLKLACNKGLTDEILSKMVDSCLELRSLDVSRCWGITEQGMQEVGKSCKEITELEIHGCGRVKNLGKDLGFSKLEVLRASGSGIDDEGLKMIAMSCIELMCLDLEGCFGVSDNGVKEVVEKCKRLRDLNLKYCHGSSDVLAWMVFARPSLRKITPPFGVAPSDLQRDLFLRHGCMINFDVQYCL